MTSILVKALEPFAKMFGELTEIKLQQGGIVFQYNNASITVSDLLNATNALALYSQSEGKPKEEILDGLNITTPLNELEGQEIYSRKEVLAAMEEYTQQFQSKENEGKQAGVEDAAKEYCSAIWLDHSAKFNGLSPSHVQRTIKDFIAGAKWASGERGEVERLKGE